MATLEAAVRDGQPLEDVASTLGRSLNAVRLRRQRYCPFPRDLSRSPGWQSGKVPGGPYWTPERIVTALRDYAKRTRGLLPTDSHAYNAEKRGHMEWPTSAAVLRQFGTMADAWAAIGAPRARYTRRWVTWTQEEDDYLLDHAGEQTLKLIARHLGRTSGACKRRLYELGAGRARDAAGYLSAMQVAREYNCPLSRVKRLIASGELPAHRVKGGHYWRIEPEDCERLRSKLVTPKRTHRTSPPELGDYERRYGLRRTRVNGLVVRIPA